LLLFLAQWVWIWKLLDFSRLTSNRMELWSEWSCSWTSPTTQQLKELLHPVWLSQQQSFLFWI
jgi:hypothetical protein